MLLLKNKNKKLTPTWHKGFDGVLDAYLGERPETFKYEGKKYTPKSFGKKFVGINPDDYIEISFIYSPPILRKIYYRSW